MAPRINNFLLLSLLLSAVQSGMSAVQQAQSGKKASEGGCKRASRVVPVIIGIITVSLLFVVQLTYALGSINVNTDSKLAQMVKGLFREHPEVEKWFGFIALLSILSETIVILFSLVKVCQLIVSLMIDLFRKVVLSSKIVPLTIAFLIVVSTFKQVLPKELLPITSKIPGYVKIVVTIYVSRFLSLLEKIPNEAFQNMFGRVKVALMKYF